MKKFLLFAIFFLLTIVIYLIAVVFSWIYIFAGTLGIMNSFMQSGELFRLKNFHLYGKKYFWKTGLFSAFAAMIFLLLGLIFVLIGEFTYSLVEFMENYSHALATFLNVFFYLSILLLSLISFLLWITYTLFGCYGIFVKNYSLKEAIVEAKRTILNHPQSIGRAGLLFVTYILTGGVLLSIGSLLAIIPHVGALLAVVYQFLIQFAHIYISLVVVAAFLSYYIHMDRELNQKNISDEEVPQPAQSPHQEESLPEAENSPPSTQV